MTGGVTTLAELRRVTHAPVSSSLFHAVAPPLRLPLASEAELEDWQERLDREVYACGCTSGAVALLASLAVLAVAQFGAGIDLGGGLRAVVVWVVAGFAAAVLGKAAGLFRARVRRRLLYAEIERSLAGRGGGTAQN